MSKPKPAPVPIRTLYTQHGIDVTHYDRDPELWPPFRSPLFEVTERADGVRTTECIALPVPHGPALRRALAFGLSPAERDAIHEFLRDGRPTFKVERPRLDVLEIVKRLKDEQASLF